jgi:hypothetical protein
MADFYQTDDINFSIPFDFISDEFNGVTTDIHQSIPPIILNYVNQIEPRHYRSFSQAAAENAASRIFLGIHWRFDAIEGVSAGDRIADIDFDTKLRPLYGEHPNHVPTVDFTAQIDAYLNNTYGRFFAPGGGGAPASASANPTQAFLTQVYHDVLRRAPDTAGLAAWGNLLNQGMSRTEVAADILASPECCAMQVTNLYDTLLNRAPDPDGLNAFVTFLEQGGTLAQVEATMMGSAEYLAGQTDGTGAGFLIAVYGDALNRAPDVAGAVSFGQQLATGVTHTAIATAIMNSPEARQNEVQTLYKQFLHRALDQAGADAFFTALQSGMSDALAEAVMIGSAEYSDHG